MDWWGWILLYFGIGVVCVPLDFLCTYHFEDKAPDKVLDDDEAEIRRLRKEAVATAKSALWCIPLWPVALVFSFCVGISKGSGGLVNLVIRKDIRRLENRIAIRKAEKIAAAYQRDQDKQLNSQFEGL